MIEVKELRRSFGPVVAVDGISFQVGRGEVLGLLGPNGAGKTTAMRMLACFIRPDSGTASVCGYDILKDPIGVRRSLGYLAENSPAYPEMTVGGFLNFICDVRQIKGPARKKALDRVVPMCSIDSVYHQTIETLSKGYKRRVGLAQALIHDPDVLILDEPTDGLDPNQKYEVRKLITAMGRDKGRVREPAGGRDAHQKYKVRKPVSGAGGDEGRLQEPTDALDSDQKQDTGRFPPETDKDKDILDPDTKHEVRRIIDEMGRDKCIIVSTHILEEVEAVCSRTIIIARGKVLVDSTPAALREKYHASLEEIFRKVTRMKKSA
jgi:ABC-2 type transport system ATP-binding protein